MNECTDGWIYQLFPITVMGEQLKPTGTLRPVRSRPRRAATAEAALLLEDWTLEQHWGEVGGVTGGVLVGMAAARVCKEGQLGERCR
jgi:hypothetical protein